jgi:hypothetical protein
MANYFEKRLTELELETSSRDISSGRRNVWGRLKGSGNGPTLSDPTAAIARHNWQGMQWLNLCRSIGKP